MIDLPMEWLKAASDDLKAAQKLIGEKSLTHIVSFHCQQVVEKSFKAVLEKYGEEIEKTHNLTKLYARISRHVKIQIDEEILLQIDEIYIEARYPGDFGLLPDGKPPVAQAEAFLAFARKVYESVRLSLEGRD